MVDVVAVVVVVVVPAATTLMRLRATAVLVRIWKRRGGEVKRSIQFVAASANAFQNSVCDENSRSPACGLSIDI